MVQTCACGRGLYDERYCCDHCGVNFAQPTPHRGTHSWLCDLFYERDQYRCALEAVRLATEGVAMGHAAQRANRIAGDILTDWARSRTP